MNNLSPELKQFLIENATLDENGKIIELKSINDELRKLTFKTLRNILHFENPLLKQKFRQPELNIEILMKSMSDIYYLIGLGHDNYNEYLSLYSNLLSGKTKYKRIIFENEIGLTCYIDFKNDYIIIEQNPIPLNYSYQWSNERELQFTDNYSNYIVKLSPWSYTIYRFYLNHPEGVSLKDDAKKHIDELAEYYEEVVFNQDKIDNFKELINNRTKWTKTINNKITELNTTLTENFFPENLKITQDEKRANNQIFFIPYYRKQFLIQNLKKK